MNVKHIKSILLAAIVAMMLPAVAQAAGPQVYGKLHLALENIDDETEVNDHWDLSSHASRFGVKGDFDTDSDTLKIIYQLEWQVDLTDSSRASDNHISSRNQYVGLQGNFGQFIAGRHDTPFKSAQGSLDQFGDGLLDIAVLMAGSENRASNMMQYTSPKIADKVSIKLMLRPGEESNGDDNNIADGTSASIAYDSDSLHVAFAFDSDIDGDNVDAARIVATWKHGDFGFGGLYQATDFGGSDDEEVFFLSAFYKLDKVKLKAQFGQTENYGGVVSLLGESNDADYFAVGLDYSLSKKSTVGVYFGSREGADNLVTPTLSGLVTGGRDIFGVNLIHKF